MILNANEIKKLERLESQPLQERMRATWDRDDIWRDRFHKSADRFYGIGATYFTRVVKASVGKPVKQVIFQLRNNPNYKHIRPFKNAVDHSINTELLNTFDEDRLSWNDVYVDDNGLIQDVKSHPNYPIHTPRPKLPDIPERQKLLEVDGKYIIRENGIHYYISYTVYMNALNAHKISWRWYNPLPVTAEDRIKIQLNTSELKKHGLENIWRK